MTTEKLAITSPLSLPVREEIDRWLLKYPPDQKQSALLTALHLAQDQNGGWLSPELIKGVADYLGIPEIAAYEAATFYSMFELKPVGRHKISVCTNISCLLSGSEAFVAHLSQRLNIGFNETTADGKFTLKEVECLAACDKAPVCQIGRDYHESLTPEKIDAILNSLE